jgi:hypothetical protein
LPLDLSRRFAGEDGFLVNEADRVTERVNGVKASLTSRLGLHRLIDGFATQIGCVSKDRVYVGDGKINMVRIRPGIKVVAVCTRVETRQDGAAAVEVMASGTYSAARLSQKLAVKGRCRFDVRYREDDAVESSHDVNAG